MKLAVVTTLHRRPQMTAIFSDYYTNLSIDGVDLVLCAAYSDAQDAVPLSDAWRTAQAPNQPRSDKWNAAAALMPDDVDAMLVAGSDDLIHESHIRQCLTMIEKGADYITPITLYVYDTLTDRLMEARFGRVGAGRMLSGRLLEQIDYVPWRPGEFRNIDRSMGLQLRGVPIRYVENTYILDVKTEENIWSYDMLHGAARWRRELDPVSWLGEWFPGQADALRTYRTTEKLG